MLAFPMALQQLVLEIQSPGFMRDLHPTLNSEPRMGRVS